MQLLTKCMELGGKLSNKYDSNIKNIQNIQDYQCFDSFNSVRLQNLNNDLSNILSEYHTNNTILADLIDLKL